MTQERVAGYADGGLMVTRADGVGRIAFNRPERRNAMSLAMWEGLHAALDALAGDEAVRVVVLSGAGGRAFVSGADIAEFDTARADADAARRYNAVSEGAERALETFPKPLIAAIRGYCFGAGVGIAAGCDIRIAADDARFAIPAARLGLGYGLAAMRRLVRLVGPAGAAELLLTAAPVDAAAARAMGLVNRVVPAESLDSEAGAMAAAIAANAPLTLAAAKAAIAAAAAPADAEAEARVEAMVAACYASEDYAEGRRAFAEKRQPVFRGI